MKSPRYQLPSFLLFSIFLFACQSSDEDTAEGSADSATTELKAEEAAPKELYNVVVAQLENEFPILIETKGILTAALEEKLGDEISLDPDLIYISILDESRYYLEGRGDRDDHPALVALELQIDEDGLLTSRSDAKLYACVANNKSGLCTFITKSGKIVGCDCVDVDTTSTCQLTVLENIQLL